MLQPIPSVPDPVDPEQEAQLDRELQELRDKVQQVRDDAAVHAPAAAASPGEVALAWCGHILSTKKTASSDSTLIALLGRNGLGAATCCARHLSCARCQGLCAPHRACCCKRLQAPREVADCVPDLVPPLCVCAGALGVQAAEAAAAAHGQGPQQSRCAA